MSAGGAAAMASQGDGYPELTQAVSEQLATPREDLPDVMPGLGDLARPAMARWTGRPRS